MSQPMPLPSARRRSDRPLQIVATTTGETRLPPQAAVVLAKIIHTRLVHDAAEDVSDEKAA